MFKNNRMKIVLGTLLLAFFCALANCASSQKYVEIKNKIELAIKQLQAIYVNPKNDKEVVHLGYLKREFEELLSMDLSVEHKEAVSNRLTEVSNIIADIKKLRSDALDARSNGHFKESLDIFEKIVAKYPGTNDAVIMNDSDIPECKYILGEGDVPLRLKRLVKTCKIYIQNDESNFLITNLEMIILEYPGTPEAIWAKEELAKLGAKTPQ